MSDLDDPTVNVKYSVFTKLKTEVSEANREILSLKAQLAEAQVTDKTGTTKLLHTALHEAIKIVQFAVGNLDPQVVVGWPHGALTAVADAISKLPVDRHVSELPPELHQFARLAAGYEEYRKNRVKIVTAATAADFGPQTPEAAGVHAAKVSTPALTPAERDEKLSELVRLTEEFGGYDKERS